jgi:short-subunit dehydrogenase
VALLDRSVEGAEALAAELRAGGAAAIALQCDVTREQECVRAIAEVASRLGGVDVLVNNAGITHFSSGAETESKVLRAVMEVNYFGAVHCTRAALPELTGRRGAIVVISSVAGFAPLLDRCGYAASKHALHGYFDTLRAELAGAVRVTLVCPTFTRTEIAKSALDGAGRTSEKAWATAGRLASPEEVAEAVVAGVERGARIVFPSRLGHVAWWTSRLMPAFYERMMLRSVRAREAV